MQNNTLLPPYWYLWLIAFVLATAAFTGFGNSMRIFIEEIEFSIKIWQFILSLAVFLAALGVIYPWLDRKNKAFPGWLKASHLIITISFCIASFIFLQVVNARRQADPRSYFDKFQYYEESSAVMVVFVVLFFIMQLIFLVYLILRIRQR